jgi:NAD(P)-dependent dehydrogenase (short-subunit alcohol dehydrogenase family)
MRYLLVGGSSTIGGQLQQYLTANGHEVISTYRDQELINQSPGALYFDATSNSPLNLDDQGLDGLVYLPGTINLKPFNRLSMDDFLNDMEINLFGAIKVLQQTLPLMKKQPTASVVLISSVAASQGMPFHSSIASAKAALEGLARSLAAELAPKIRVNVIAPSLVKSALSASLLSTEQRVTNSTNRHPLKSIGEPEDIAQMAAYLLTDPGRWITGQTFAVDGGMSTVKG